MPQYVVIAEIGSVFGPFESRQEAHKWAVSCEIRDYKVEQMLTPTPTRNTDQIVEELFDRHAEGKAMEPPMLVNRNY